MSPSDPSPAEINETLKLVALAAEEFTAISDKRENDAEGTSHGDVEEVRRKLLSVANDLVYAIRGPAEMTHSHCQYVCSSLYLQLNRDHSDAFQASQVASIRVLLDIGAFDAMPLDGSPMSATALSEQLKVDKGIIGGFKLDSVHEQR